MLINIIHLLKFLQIDFPDNVVHMFKNKPQVSGLYKPDPMTVNIEDKNLIKDKFKEFKVSAYILNNYGSTIIQIYSLIFFARIFLIVFNRLEKKFFTVNDKGGKKIMRLIFKYFDGFLIWNLPCIYYSAKYHMFVFFILVNYLFPPINSALGILNFMLSFLFFTMNFLFIVHIVVVNYIIKEKNDNNERKDTNNKPFSKKINAEVFKRNNIENKNNFNKESKSIPLTIYSNDNYPESTPRLFNKTKTIENEEKKCDSKVDLEWENLKNDNKSNNQIQGNSIDSLMKSDTKSTYSNHSEFYLSIFNGKKNYRIWENKEAEKKTTNIKNTDFSTDNNLIEKIEKNEKNEKVAEVIVQEKKGI